MIRPKLVQPAFFLISISAQRRFFFEGPKVSEGKRLETVGDCTFDRQKGSCFVAYVHQKCLKIVQKTCLFCRAKVRSPTVSNRFPLDTFGPSKKKRRCAEMLIKKKGGLDKFWPDHVSDRFRPFPTVSDRFIFSERLIGPIPFMEA